MGVRETDSYFHVDMNHGSFNSMKSDSVTRHKSNFPQGELSVFPNVAGTEAIVKVRGGKGWAPGWLNAPFVKRVYTKDDHNEVKTLLQTPEWKPPQL